MSTDALVTLLLIIAWLLPLAGAVACAAAILTGWTHRLSRAPGFVATACISGSFLAAFLAFVWAGEQRGTGRLITGELYPWAEFGPLKITLDYAIDGVTLVLFLLVGFIATAVHVFALGYMNDELTEEYEDHSIIDAQGLPFTRPGRLHRFFAALQLFCWAMFGLLLAGNLLQVFVFWELVGFCSYLLIGFYFERPQAASAANKAFLMNRVGDVGFLIGLMILWTSTGTLQLASATPSAATDSLGSQASLIKQLKGNDQAFQFTKDRQAVLLHAPDGDSPESIPTTWLIAAGLGLFAGCVGKSAQFPLQTWLPDAMAGPTPVSALVHSATMVAAGVYLAARISPILLPEVLGVIALVACVTIVLGALSALVATDLKQILADSTISQLGYMLLAIGVAAPSAGLFHLVTHAGFKALLFLSAGSVIIACHHHQQLSDLGGLWKRLPITGTAMLIGVIAITGLSVPWVTFFGEPIAFSGHHSKDAILVHVAEFAEQHSGFGGLLIVALGMAGVTSLYMFRMWFLVFLSPSRNVEVTDHVRENSWFILGPLLVLAVFAIGSGAGGEQGLLARQLFAVENAVSQPSMAAMAENTSPAATSTASHDPHEEHHTAAHHHVALWATLLAWAGAIGAYGLFVKRWVNLDELAAPWRFLRDFLIDHLAFDRVYDVLCVRPLFAVATVCRWCDARCLDAGLHLLTRWVVDASLWDRWVDDGVIDRSVIAVGETGQRLGALAPRLQTGSLRHYILWIGAGVAALFVTLAAIFPGR